MIDTHCHLDLFEGEERDAVIARAVHALAGAVAISTELGRAGAVADAVAAARAAGLRCGRTVGLHPCHVGVEPPPEPDAILALAEAPDVVGIGESGLDHVSAPVDTRDAQERSFRAHIEAARRSGLPLVVHARGADAAVAAVLEDEHGRGGAFPFVMHCFASGADLAARALALGGAISFSGILTFPKSDALRAIARAVPADRLLVETDAPFLSPVPHRGKRNEPAHVVHTASVLAAARDVPIERLAPTLDANAHRVFARLER